MQPNLNMVIDQVGKDKNIDRKILVQTLEQRAALRAQRRRGAVREGLHALGQRVDDAVAEAPERLGVETQLGSLTRRGDS